MLKNGRANLSKSERKLKIGRSIVKEEDVSQSFMRCMFIVCALSTDWLATQRAKSPAQVAIITLLRKLMLRRPSKNVLSVTTERLMKKRSACFSPQINRIALPATSSMFGIVGTGDLIY